MSALERGDEQADRNRRRAYNCGKCGASWSLLNVTADALPASVRDAAFAEIRYDYCGACGNLRVKPGR